MKLRSLAKWGFHLGAEVGLYPQGYMLVKDRGGGRGKRTCMNSGDAHRGRAGFGLCGATTCAGSWNVHDPQILPAVASVERIVSSSKHGHGARTTYEAGI